MKTYGLILAAGMSNRMQTYKPLLMLHGKTMIEHSIDSMYAGGAEKVIVVTGYRKEEVESLLQRKYSSERLELICNYEYETSQMLDSIRIGVGRMKGCQAFYLLPGDMPAVGRQTYIGLRHQMAKSGARVVFPAIDGYRKHPPLISIDCIPRILQFEGQGGLRELWRKMENEIEYFSVSDLGCTMDADTPEDFKKLYVYLEESFLLMK